MTEFLTALMQGVLILTAAVAGVITIKEALDE